MAYRCAVIGTAAVYLIDDQMIVFQFFFDHGIGRCTDKASCFYGACHCNGDHFSDFCLCQCIVLSVCTLDCFSVCHPLVRQCSAVIGILYAST